MNNFNVVGDIAGQYKALKALLAKMPQDASLISLGDPNDRGPQSKEVIEFLMTTGQTVNSNHAHMMIEAWEQSANPKRHQYYESGIWYGNGGRHTMGSYASTEDYNGEESDKRIHKVIPKEHIEWLKNCPMYIKSEGFVFTHAPLNGWASLEEASNLGEGFIGYDMTSDQSLIWNRGVPHQPNKRLKGKVNIFGHNSSNKVKLFSIQHPDGIKINSQDQFTELWSMRDKYPVYAICLDTSGAKVLTGLHLPTMMLYSQEYI